MPEPVTAWRAGDGQVFASEDECRRHDLRLAMTPAIADPAGVDFVCLYPQSVFDLLWDTGYRRSVVS